MKGAATSGGLTTGRVLLFPIAFCARWAHPKDVSPEVGGVKGLHRDLPLREGLDASHQLSTRPANPITKLGTDEAVNGRMRDAEVHREAVEGEAMPLAVGDNRVRHAPIVPGGPEMASSFLAEGTVACIVPVGHNQAMVRRGRPKSAPPAPDQPHPRAADPGRPDAGAARRAGRLRPQLHLQAGKRPAPALRAHGPQAGQGVPRRARRPLRARGRRASGRWPRPCSPA
jgi:hypothetical protein